MAYLPSVSTSFTSMAFFFLPRVPIFSQKDSSFKKKGRPNFLEFKLAAFFNVRSESENYGIFQITTTWDFNGSSMLKIWFSKNPKRV
jgi:hypothetical protein